MTTNSRTRSGNQPRTQRRAIASRKRRLELEPLESRSLLAVELLEIVSNVGGPVQDGSVRNLAPRELTFRFSHGEVVDPTTLHNIIVTRTGFDGTFGEPNDVQVEPGYVGIGRESNEVLLRFAESLPDDLYRIQVRGSATPAAATTDFNSGGAVFVRFASPSERGNGIELHFTRSDHGGPSAPSITVNGRLIQVNLNINAARPTTAALLVDTLNNHPDARRLLRAEVTSGNPLQNIAVTDLGYTPVILSGGSGVPLLFEGGDAFHSGRDQSVQFDLDLGAQVVAVVPQPVLRSQVLDVLDPNRLRDGDRFSVHDGVGSVVFEFEDTAVGNGITGDVAIRFARTQPAGTVGAAIRAAVRGAAFAGPGVSVSGTGASVTLQGVAFTPELALTTSLGNSLRHQAGGLSQLTDTIVVYFNEDDLDPRSAENVNLYQLFDTRGTLATADDTVQRPTGVRYDAAVNSAILTFAAAIPRGQYHLRVGTSELPITAVTQVSAIDDANSSLATATNLGALGTREIVVSSQIEPQSISLPAFPGDRKEPGHRDLPETALYGQHENASDEPSVPTPIRVFPYNFRSDYGTDPIHGTPLLNEIDELQKRRAREIFELYAADTGFQFVETDATGLAVVTGDTRVCLPGDTTIAGVFCDGGTTNGPTVVINGERDYGDNPYGGLWFTTALDVIAEALGLGDAHEFPSVTGSGLVSRSGAPLEGVYPGDHDRVHLQRISRPDATDIDLFQFRVARPGLLTLDALAERLPTTSLLNAVLQLYDGTGQLIARNDNYFSDDPYIELRVSPGTYYVGLTSTGNTLYDPTIPDSGFGGTTDGRYELHLKLDRDPATSLVDATGTPLDGDADGVAGGVFDFGFESGNTIFVDKLHKPGPGGADGSLGNPYDRITQAVVAANADPAIDIIRIAGNGTEADSAPYLVGRSANRNLSDGRTFQVPRGVTVMIDEGAVLKLANALIDVGTSAVGLSRDHAAVQLLGTPRHDVILTSYADDSVGGDSDGFSDGPNPGDWGGVVFRNDSDHEEQGIFLNYVSHADLRYGGGKVTINSVEDVFTPLHLVEARPTVMFSRISQSADAAISADPNSFSDRLGRIGPDVHGNRLVDNSINGIFVRIRTNLGEPIDRLEETARFDDTDIVHVITENLEIVGNPGGPLGTQARPGGRLAIDPGTVVKLRGSRIETLRGSAGLIAEGTSELPIIFTSLVDDRYGAGGTFDTTSDGARSQPAAGDWAGLVFEAASHGSIDRAVISFGGGLAPIAGGSDRFNVIEVHQADLRLANSRLEDNADGLGSTDRNARGTNRAATIFVRGAQPQIVNNVFADNLGSTISINANSLRADVAPDYGRSRGRLEAFREFADNRGPLVRLNRYDNDLAANPGHAGSATNGMEVRGEELTTESVWDDTDIVHVLRDEIVVWNHHVYSGLRLQSDAERSLVIKLGGPNAGITANGELLDIDDRIGGTLQVLGAPQFPVIFTSLADDGVGASLRPDDLLHTDTNHDGGRTSPQPGDWRSIRIDRFANDRNVRLGREVEQAFTRGLETNGIPDDAQFLGELAPLEKAGDDNRVLGFEVHGYIGADHPSDTDVYSFLAHAGTQVWLDLDRTSSALESAIDLIDADGNVLATSVKGLVTGIGLPLIMDLDLGRDSYSLNRMDAGLRVELPGTPGDLGTYFVRVRSEAGLTRGEYQLQIRLQQRDEKPGSTVRFADVRFATNGIEVRGMPGHSPLASENSEQGDAGGTPAAAQSIGNLLVSERNTINVGGVVSANDVDFYRLDIDSTAVGSTPPGGRTWAAVFDIDYADGLTRADTSISVFDAAGNLVVVARESNIGDDQPLPEFGTQLDDLSRGSVGPFDPFIGTIQLPENDNQSYFVAVTSNRMAPSSIRHTFDPRAANSLTRLEPINSVRRIVEDHVGSQGYDSHGNFIAPTTPGIVDILQLEAHVQPLALDDVVLYVSTNGNELAAVNPNRGGTRYVVGTIPPDVEDIAMRTDGRFFAQRSVTGLNTAGELLELDPDTTSVLSNQLDGIPGPAFPPTPTPYSDEITFTDQVDALTFDRRGVGSYELFYSIRDEAPFITQSKLYRANQDGSGARFVGDINARRASARAIMNGADIHFLARRDGDPGNGIRLEIAAQDFGGPAAPRIRVIDGNIIRVTVNSNVNNETTAQEFVDAINTHPEAGLLVRAGIYAGAGGTDVSVLPAGGLKLVTQGGVGRPLRGQTTGLALVGSTGAMYGVSSAGEFYLVNKSSGHSTLVRDLLLDFGITDLQGLSTGPQNVEGGRYSGLLFAVTGSGLLYALDPLTGAPQKIFDSNGDGTADALSVFVSSGGLSGEVRGLAFSPLDWNLWHPTGRRSADAGHGINAAFDGSRESSPGASSLWFGFEGRQFGVRNDLADDLASNPNIINSYHFAAGAFGTFQTLPFSLKGQESADRPTLYFNYFLDTQDQNSAANMLDSARILVSRDGGAHWEPLASNNSAPISATRRAEIAPFASHLASASRDPLQRVQLLHDASTTLDRTWRQARVDLSEFAGAAELVLRFDFSTAGTVSDPTYVLDRPVPADAFGTLYSPNRGFNNRFEGMFIDDLIIGSSERGEMVTASGTDSTFFAVPTNPDPTAPAERLSGPYQLEIRRGTEYQQILPDLARQITTEFDNNARLTNSVTIIAPRGDQLTDGTLLRISDGFHGALFEFDNDGITSSIPIFYNSSDSDAEIAGKIAGAVEANRQLFVIPDVTPTSNRVLLHGAVEAEFVSVALNVTVDIPVDSIDETGSTSATVTREGATTAPLLVRLINSDPDQATVPASVLIRAGDASATFTIRGVPETIDDGHRTIVVQPVASGLVGVSDIVDIRDNDDPLLTLALSPDSASESAGPNSVTAVITRNTALDRPETVTIASLDPTELLLGSTTTSLYGSTLDGSLFVIDVGTGAATTIGVLPIDPATGAPASTEIEVQEFADEAFVQYPGTSFRIRPFDLDTGASLGAAVRDGGEFAGLEFVGSLLFGTFTDAAGGPSSLAVLNPATGVRTLIGPTGRDSIGGLAYDHRDGTMYGLTSEGGASDLVRIDLATGTATLVGPTGFRGASLEFGPDGNLYAGGAGADAGGLFRVDRATGRGFFVGDTGFSTDITGLTLRGFGNGLTSRLTVTIPAGSRSITVGLTPVDDFLIDGDQVVNVAAFGSGFHSAEDQVTIVDSRTVRTLTLTITGPRVVSETAGAGATQATVTRNFVGEDLVVNLISHDLSELTVPNQILLPAGVNSASFQIDAIDDVFDDGPKTVELTAYASGFTSDGAAVTVLDDTVDKIPPGAIVWSAKGPGPTQGGQVENVSPNNEVVGAIHAVLAHPTNPDILWIGAVNGGIWKTTNATAAVPSWTPVTDQQSSLSIGAMALHPTDPNTLIAGFGHMSSFGLVGGALNGLLLSTDGGDTWAPLGRRDLTDRSISGVAIRGAGSTARILVTSTNFAASNGGIYLSTDGGATFTLISGGSGLPLGGAFDLVGDPNEPNRLYASVEGAGIFRTNDAGDTWTNITASDVTIDTAITNFANNNTEMAVSPVDGRLYAGVMLNGQLNYFGHYNPGSGVWTSMDLPQTPDAGGSGNEGLNPRAKAGGQGFIHFSITADPTNADIVYVGGDRQDTPFPNFIGAVNFTGRLFRGDASATANGGSPSPQWAHLTHRNDVVETPDGGTASSSSPHADSRDMTFTADGQLIEVDDGGIYRRTQPRNNRGDWFSIIGNLQVTEFHDIAYDSNADIILGGAQDTGTHFQTAPNSPVYFDISQGDGGDVVVDTLTSPGLSIRYSSFQFLFGFARRTYDATNTLISTVFPNLAVSGAQFGAQFSTPVEINAVDPRRLIFGASNNPYESLDQGDNITELTMGGGVNWFDGSPIAYGGRRGGVDNPEVLYVGSGNQVFVRTAGTGAPLATAFPGGSPRDIVLDPDDWRHAYVATPSGVWKTMDAGGTWADVTGNLAGLDDDFHTIEFSPVNQAVFVGGRSGVFQMLVAAPRAWGEFGVGLPNVPVWDMDLSVSDDVLLVGTLGRGAWATRASGVPGGQNLVATIVGPTVLVEGDGPGASTVRISRPTSGGALAFTLRSSDASEITLDGSGSDTFSGVIPDGAFFVDVALDVVDDAEVDGPQTVILIPSADGFDSVSAAVDVLDDPLDAAPRLSVTVLNPDTIAEDGRTRLRVERSDGIGPLTVAILNSDSTEATSVTTVTLPNGRRSTIVELNAVDDRLLDGTQTSIISVRAGLTRMFVVPTDDPTKIAEIDSVTGLELNRFGAPDSGGRGLAFDGRSVYFVSPAGDKIYRLDPTDGNVQQTILINAGAIDGLAYLEGDLFLADPANDLIHRLDLSTGTIVEQILVSGDLRGGLAGITDPDRLIATLGTGPTVVEIDPATGEITRSFDAGRSGYEGVGGANGLVYLGRSSGNLVDVFTRSGETRGSLVLPYSVTALGADDQVGRLPRNYEGIADVLDITDRQFPRMTLDIAAASLLDTAGPAATTATVTIAFPLEEDLEVTLISSDVSEVTVPASVTIPAGATTALFAVGVVDEFSDDGTRVVRITAFARDFASATDELAIVDATRDTGAGVLSVNDLGDDSFHREQGQVVIEQNIVRDASQWGIVVDAGVRDPGSNASHPGSVINTPVLNSRRLVPGIVVENNVVANLGTGGILLSGDTGAPLAAITVSKITNNTIYGRSTPAGIGIRIEENSSPTLVNNVVANTVLAIEKTTPANVALVVETTLFQNNTSNGVAGNNAIVLRPSEPLFVAAPANNFYPARGSDTIDSSLNKSEERTILQAVKEPLGLPPSDIFAPDRDLFGQLRLDDPSQEPPPGLGSNIFKDRGAVERADFIGPVAVITVPGDNDGLGLDLNPERTRIHIQTNDPLTRFVVRLADEGISIDDLRVNSQQFVLQQTGSNGTVTLVDGRDYFFIYNGVSNEVRFVAATRFAVDNFYELTIDNSADTGVQDLAGNRLQNNRADGSTAFTILLSDDANDPPRNLLPETATLDEDGTLVFSTANANPVSVEDVDAHLGTNRLEVTLTAVHGVVRLSGVAGLTFRQGDGVDDATMTFAGAIPDLRAALEGLSFVAEPDYFGAASLTILTDDLGNFVSPPTTRETDTDTIRITVQPVNDAPLNVLPGTAQKTDEDTRIVFSVAAGNAIQVTDRDVAAGTGKVEVTLTATGTLKLSRITGLTFTNGDGTDDAAMTFAGSLANVNAALDGLSLLPPLNFNGTTTLEMTTNDLGNFGAGGPMLDADILLITVSPINDAPVNHVPARQSAAEETAFVFDAAGGNQLSIEDVDVAEGDGTIQVNLSVTNGVLRLSRTGGLTFLSGDGLDDASMSFTGLLTDVNAALDGLVFVPATGFTGVARLTITSDDRGNAGAGGRRRDTDVIEIDVAAVNDPPVHTVPGAQSTDEDVALVFSAANGNLISVDDPDAGGGTLEITLVAANGTITLASTTELVFSTGDGSDDPLLVFRGKLARLNAALSQLSFLPAANFNDTDIPSLGGASLTVTTNDLGNTGDPGPQSDTDTISIAVQPVNDAPVHQLGASAATNEDQALVFSAATGNLISIVDVDVLDGNGTVEVALSAAGGTLTLGSVADLTFSAGDGADDSLMTFRGNVVAANAALAGITFQPQADFNDLLGTASLTISTSDLGNSGSGTALTDTDTLVIGIRPVNDAPTITAKTTDTTAEDTRLTFTTTGGNAIAIADVDVAEAGVGRDFVRVTLTAANGTFDLDRRVGLRFSVGDGVGDVTATFRGLEADVNAALATLSFLPSRDFNESLGEGRLTVTVDDLGNTGSGGRQTATVDIQIAVTAVNDTPVHTAPRSASTDEDQPLVFSVPNGNRISVSDVDILDGTGELLVTLQAEGGLVTIDVQPSLTFTTGDGTADQVMTFSGPFADVRRALAVVTFAPDENFNDSRGTSSLTFITNDLGNAGAGGQQIATTRIPISVRPINDAPVISAPSSQTTEEDRRLVFSINNANLLSIDDVDAAETTGAFEVTLTATHGVVSVRTDTTVTFTTGDGVDDTTLTFRGPLTDVNLALSNVRFTPDLDFNTTDVATLGAAHLEFTASDLGNAGAGGRLNDRRLIDIEVTPVDDAPILTVPGSQTTAEDTAFVFSAAAGNPISVADRDADEGNNRLEVTLTATQGTVTLPTTTGLTLVEGDGTGDALVTFQGTVARVNAALNRLRFLPAPDFNSGFGQARLTIDTNDLGNFGAGGPLNARESIEITVTSVNDEPVITAPATQVMDEDATHRFSGETANRITVADVDATEGTGIVQVSLTASGSLTLGDLAGLTFTAGDGTADASMTFSGSLSAVNTALNGLAYTPLPDLHGATQITIDVDDLGNVGDGGRRTASHTIQVTIRPTNDAPIVKVPATQATEEDTPLVLNATNGNLVSISDVDAGGGSIAVELSAINGVLTLARLTGLTFTEGDGTSDGLITFTSTLANANAALANLAFRPAANFVGTAQVTLSVDDQGSTGGTSLRDAATFDVDVRPVNDAPVNQVPGTQTVDEDTGLTFSGTTGNLIAVADVDASAGTMQITLTATNGLISLGSVTGLTFVNGDGVGDSAMTFTGTLNTLNSALGSIQFSPTTEFSGTARIDILTDDRGNSGAGSALTDSDSITINVRAVNDPPIAADDVASVSSGQSVAIAVTINDSDVDGTLALNSITIVSGGGPAHGTARANANGTITYTPSAGFLGTDSFQYQIRDNNSAQSQAATVTVRVNNPPVAVDDTATTKQREPVSIEVLGNDSDPDGTLVPNSVVVVNSPDNGTVAVDGAGVATYTPNGGFFGADTWTYTVADNDGRRSNEATVTVTVTRVFPFQNPRNRFDVNNDGAVSAIDVLLIVNLTNTNPAFPGPLPSPPTPGFSPPPYYDVNGDGSVSAIDAAEVTSFINRRTSSPEAEAARTPRQAALLAGSSGPSSLGSAILEVQATGDVPAASRGPLAAAEFFAEEADFLGYADAPRRPVAPAPALEDVLSEIVADVGFGQARAAEDVALLDLLWPTRRAKKN